MSAPALTQRRPNATAFAGVFAASLFCFLAVGAALPVLPRYVVGPLGGSDVDAGLVTGAFAFAAIVGRPIGGRMADGRGRRIVVVTGLLLVAASGALLFVPWGIGGLIVARLVLGWGIGWVFTAGLAWTVDLAPEDKRGRAIAFYGLAVWGGLSAGPLAGEGALAAGGYDAVWALSAALPLVGAAIARVVPDRRTPTGPGAAPRRLVPRPAVLPGLALFLASVGYATLATFVVLHLEDPGSTGGAAVFTAMAATVVGSRVLLFWLPDHVGPRVTAIGCGIAQAAGLALIAAAQGLPVAIAGAMVMGTGFSLAFPSLAMLVVEHVGEHERGAAMGAFSAFFDLGVGVGAPAAGAVSALAGYSGAFAAAACAAALGAVLAATTSRSGPSPGPR